MLLPRPKTPMQSTSPTAPHFVYAHFPCGVSSRSSTKRFKAGRAHSGGIALSPDSLLVESTESLRESEHRRTTSARALVPTGERTRTFPSSSSRDARWLRECLACSFSEFHAPYEQLRILFYLVVLLESLRAFRGPGLLDLLFMIRGRRIR